MLNTEPMAPAINDELDEIIKRLACLRENFDSLANDFGVHLDHPEMVHPNCTNPPGLGIDKLRLSITEINVQIGLIEQQHERLFAARAQLFGVGDGQWQTEIGPVPSLSDDTPKYAPVRTGDFRAH